MTARTGTPTRPRRSREAGNITLFFLLLVFVLLGALSYSLFIGRTVQEKMRTESAADAAALSMANHTAAGLNLIAVNNLAIAANLHTAAAVPFIGRYYAVIRALMVSVSDTGNVIADLDIPGRADDSVFATGFKASKDFTGLLTTAAAGNTELNHLLVKTWFLKTLPLGIRTARIDAPGALVVPSKLLTGAFAGDVGAAFKVQKLAQTTPSSAFCHTIASSEVLGERRNSVAFWMQGLLASTTANADWLGPLADFETVVQTIVGAIDTALKPVRIALKAAGAIACDIMIIPNPACIAMDKLESAFEAVTTPPIPRFTDCGITHNGDFARQAQAFAEEIDGKHDIGFVFPDVRTPEDLAAFEDSLDQGVVLAKPLFLKDELPQDGASTLCPEGWRWTTPNGTHHCEALLDGVDFGSASSHPEPSSFDTASGGVGAATGTGLGGDAKLRSLLARTQWALAEGKAEYHPEGDDPGAAATYALKRPDQVADAVTRTRVQLFWPAWRGRNAPTKAMDTVLSFLGRR